MFDIMQEFLLIYLVKQEEKKMNGTGFFIMIYGKEI
jgi:hypothetical protein